MHYSTKSTTLLWLSVQKHLWWLWHDYKLSTIPHSFISALCNVVTIHLSILSLLCFCSYCVYQEIESLLCLKHRPHFPSHSTSKVLFSVSTYCSRCFSDAIFTLYIFWLPQTKEIFHLAFYFFHDIGQRNLESDFHIF